MTRMPGERVEGHYRVVEVADVCDQEIESALNRMTGKGYRFETLHFVVPAGSRRPSLAFLFFTRDPGFPGG